MPLRRVVVSVVVMLHLPRSLERKREIAMIRETDSELK
jgi:hypothetical protein